MADNKAKRYCFTINNPTEEDLQLLIGNEEHPATANYSEVQYLILQEERGENETLHWQGFLILKKPQRLSWLKNNINPRAHFEVARGTNEQARDYCRKDETYTGGLRYEFGQLPERKKAGKHSERLEAAAEELDTVKENYKRPREIESMVLMQPGFLQAYRELTTDVLGPYRNDLRIITMVGPPGCGKSFCIQKHFPGHGRCIVGNSGIWFQNPLADVMVFEEFVGQIQLQRMLQFLDPYPLALEVKGSMRPAMYTLAIITSNTPPTGWYKGEEAGTEGKRTDAIKALWDRIGYNGGGYIPVRTCGHYLEAPLGYSIEELRNWFDDQVTRLTHEPDEDDEQEQRRQIGY